MDEAHRQMARHHLAEAERFAELGLKHIARQKRQIPDETLIVDQGSRPTSQINDGYLSGLHQQTAMIS